MPHPAFASDTASRGRVYWILGYWRAVRGRMASALEPYHDSLAAYERLEESDSVAWLQFLIGELYGYMGRSAQGWSFRRAAIASVPRLADRDRAFSVLLGSSMVALQEGRPRTAAVLLDEILAGPSLDTPDQQAQAHLWRCRIRIALGDVAGARADLQRAAAWTARASDVVSPASSAVTFTPPRACSPGTPSKPPLRSRGPSRTSRARAARSACPAFFSSVPAPTYAPAMPAPQKPISAAVFSSFGHRAPACARGTGSSRGWKARTGWPTS